MTWEWISEQALPMILVILFIYGIRKGEIYTKTSYGLVTEQRDEYKDERDEARLETKAVAEKLDEMTRNMAASQSEEREAMAAEIAFLRARLSDPGVSGGQNSAEGQP